MKIRTILAAVLLGIAALAIPACKSPSGTTTTSVSATDVTSAINNIATALSSSTTTQAVTNTVTALQQAGAIDQQTAAEAILADTIFNQVSNVVTAVTASGTSGKAVALSSDRLRDARRAEFTAILTAHKAAIRPVAVTKVLGIY